MLRRWGQPAVVGEMVAGVLLGPSLLGLFLPDLQARLFPPASMPTLYALANVGLALYMFLVGVEFRADLAREHVRSAAFVSLAGIAAPFVLGAALAAWMWRSGGLFGPQAGRLEASLFLGAAMSITAFPMLARILRERGLTGTPLGALALAAGSIDDALAWCILALVLAAFGDGFASATVTIGGGALYAAAILRLVRPALRRLEARRARTQGLEPHGLAAVLILLLLCSWVTDAIGMHSVFGAFVLGAAMPRGRVAAALQATLGPLTTVVFVPLFFVYSGLNTRMGLVTGPELWLLAAVVLATACAGKGVACWLAMRSSGWTQRESVGMGALMNARGLMELVLLNIGLERGLITPTLFSVMVLMAVATTLMATPVFELAMRGAAPRAPAAVQPPGTR